jgi:omega-6 fatty acid desaturase (delta-12 desaturase)
MTTMPLPASLAPERALPGSDDAPGSPAVGDGRYWRKVLAAYREPSHARSVAEIAVTIIPFVVLWLTMYMSLQYSYWLTLLLAIPAAGFLVRLFMIQHDCGHGSFFRRKHANDWTGRLIGVLTLTPYSHWRHAHAMHHASSGNLDRRGIGDIDTLTVREFLALSPWRRLLYRLFRSPIVMLGIGPLYLFVLRHRLPTSHMLTNREAWRSVMSTNLAIAAVIVTAVLLIDLQDFLLVQLPITWIAAIVGVWLFYVQHQFEHGYWEHDGRWDQQAGALHGSSHLDLPPVLRWFTANIGVHHVHHLASRIPSYRLTEVLRDHPELAQLNRLTLKDSLHCFRLALWNEETQTVVGFRAALARAGTGAEPAGQPQ